VHQCEGTSVEGVVVVWIGAQSRGGAHTLQRVIAQGSGDDLKKESGGGVG